MRNVYSVDGFICLSKSVPMISAKLLTGNFCGRLVPQETWRTSPRTKKLTWQVLWETSKQWLVGDYWKSTGCISQETTKKVCGDHRVTDLSSTLWNERKTFYSKYQVVVAQPSLQWFCTCCRFGGPSVSGFYVRPKTALTINAKVHLVCLFYTCSVFYHPPLCGYFLPCQQSVVLPHNPRYTPPKVTIVADVMHKEEALTAGIHGVVDLNYLRAFHKNRLLIKKWCTSFQRCSFLYLTTPQINLSISWLHPIV